MKKKQQSLVLQMGIFYFIVILLLGLIIISEKKKEIIIPKVEKKLNKYITETYKEEKLKKEKIKYNKQENIYSIKVLNKQNNDLYFYVNYNYKTKKITTTYKVDYKEGKSLFKEMEKKQNKDLTKKLKENPTTLKNISITYNTKLTDCTQNIKDELLNKNYNTPLYTINLEVNISKLTSEILTKKLTTIKNYFKQLDFIPKDYNIILNNKTTPTKSINIKIEQDTLNKNLEEISNLIITNDKETLKLYNIEYKYLN